jgi:hypothetical protein
MVEQTRGIVRLISRLVLPCIVLFALFDFAAAGLPAASANSAGQVFLFRGIAGLIFSRGMDQLAEELNQVGVTASVHGFVACSSVAETAIRAYRQFPSPITVVGHSAGGSCALKFAEMLQAENIPVSLVITIDPTRFDQIFDYKLPLNVERYINVYQSDNILGGRNVLPERGFRGHYASFDLTDHKEINHINIDKIESVHEQLVAKIRQIAVTPANDHGKRVPIHFDVPADALIELWDSGMPAFARAGDTMQTLATIYHVPIWSLTQINQMPDDVVLAKGQHVVVPRHLVPLAAPGTGAVLGRTPSMH